MNRNLVKLRSILQRDGWCALADGSASLLEIANSLGEPIASPGHPVIQSLLARPKNAAPKNSMSGLFGFGDFPPHTDVAHWHMPARYVLLRCASGTSSTPTVLIDSSDFLTDRQRRQWGRTTWKVTRIASPFLCSLTFSVDGIAAIRWDPCCLVPYGKRAEELLPEVIETLALALRVSGHVMTWKSSESILVIDNWRVLHARPAVSEPPVRRELQRVLVKGDSYAKA
jgi:alpha-ketoglutarate-dependent taurine dioxygenase